MGDRIAAHRHDNQAGLTRLTVSGEIDVDTSEILSALIAEAAAQPGTTGVVIDLHQVSFLDAAGIRALLASRETAQQHGCTYHVANPRGLVRRALEITGVLQILNVISVESVADPAGFRQPGPGRG
jgi:anti-sigma B factor antagonist